MPDSKDYKALLTEIIAKQAVILGPEMAVLKARNVDALSVSDTGAVTEIKGDPQAALKALIDEYVELSGLIVKNALGSIFEKYPDIDKVD